MAAEAESTADCSDLEEEDDWEYAGLEAIDRACMEVYPDQPNPLQATAVVKFWYVNQSSLKTNWLITQCVGGVMILTK